MLERKKAMVDGKTLDGIIIVRCYSFSPSFEEKKKKKKKGTNRREKERKRLVRSFLLSEEKKKKFLSRSNKTQGKKELRSSKHQTNKHYTYP